MKTCALLTCDDLSEFVTDENYLEEALTRNSWQYEWVPWKKQGVNWDQYDCAIVRTTWDYTDDPSLFIEQLKQIKNSSCQLFNDFSLIDWNWKKTYLKEMAEWGIKVIPTYWAESFQVQDIQKAKDQFATEELVVKPLVGAGAKNTFKIKGGDWPDLSVIENSQVMIQPFQKNVASEGEYSVHFFNEEHSHTILKTPKSGDYRSQEEYGSHIREVTVPASILNECHKILEKLPSLPLFSRLDFIKSDDGEYQLIELELIEPSLYFRMSEGSAERFVQALVLRSS